MTVTTYHHSEDTATLQNPRILCLHGGGTNARIFRLQCRVLSPSISHNFRLVYAQAPFPTHPGSDVTSVYKAYGPFKGWLRTSLTPPLSDCQVTRSIIRSLKEAMEDDDCKGASGEWVAILGFSQGAKIAASILCTQQARRKRQAEEWRNRDPPTYHLPDFKFGILLAGRGPLVWLDPQYSKPAGLLRASSPATSIEEPGIKVGDDAHILRIPTIHVHGLKDPGLELHRRLLERYCDEEMARVLEWEGEHRIVLKSHDVRPVVELIYEVAREEGVLSTW